MKIRNGNYTVYNGYHLKLFKSRHEDESQIENKNKPFLIFYSDSLNCPFFDFTKSLTDDSYYKIVNKPDLLNAYYVTTFGYYKGFKVIVEENELKEEIVNIKTYDQKAKEMNNFYQFTDWKNKTLYVAQVKADELDKLWEERTKTEFDLPLPKEIEFIKDIKI